VNGWDWLDWIIFGIAIFLGLGAIGTWLNGLLVTKNKGSEVWEQYAAASLLATLSTWIFSTLFN
jgi:hypothetical protein